MHYDSRPLGHTKIESTVRYLGIEIDDAIEIAGENRRLKYLGRAAVLCPAQTGERVPEGEIEPHRPDAEAWRCEYLPNDGEVSHSQPAVQGISFAVWR